MILYSMAAVAAAGMVSASQTLDVNAFDRVRNSGSADIELRVDPKHSGDVSVQIDGEQEAIDRLEIRVEDNTLIIGQKRGSWGSWKRSPTITATIASLREVKLSGSGDLRARGLQGGALTLRGSGSGDMDVEGKVGDLRVSIAGSGDVKVRGVEASDVQIGVQGSGDVRVSGRADQIEIKVAGSGDVDASALKAVDAVAKIMGSADIQLCATGRVKQKTMGSGDIELNCN